MRSANAGPSARTSPLIEPISRAAPNPRAARIQSIFCGMPQKTIKTRDMCVRFDTGAEKSFALRNFLKHWTHPRPARCVPSIKTVVLIDNPGHARRDGGGYDTNILSCPRGSSPKTRHTARYVRTVSPRLSGTTAAGFLLSGEQGRGKIFSAALDKAG